MTSTTAAPIGSAHIEHHRCIAVTCTTCGQSFNDDFTHHFASLPHALRFVTSDDWVLTPTGVLCWSCADHLEHDRRPAPATVAVAKCEYCWPPLFSDAPVPGSCCCNRLASTTTHVLVPLVALTHPGFEQHACVTICCPECQARLGAEGDEMGEPHFDSPAAALLDAHKTYDWLVTGTLTCCAACARSRECAVLGHQLPDAPDRITDDGIERRWCRHCTAEVMNPITDREMPWL